MSLRLGNGEYERIDVETKNSTFVARHKFLETLWKKRSDWAFDLLRLFNYEELPEELLTRECIDKTFISFLPHLLTTFPHEIEIQHKFIDTPVIHYFSYFFGKEDLIKQFEDEEEQSLYSSPNTIRRRKNVIKKIIPGWKEIKSKEDANVLCLSLESWANKYNLNADWLMDFALDILCLFKINFDWRLSDFDAQNLSKTNNYHLHYQNTARDSISEAISAYAREIIWEKQWCIFDELKGLPAFEYRFNDFEMQPITWMFSVTSRKNFVEAANNRLLESKMSIKTANEKWFHSLFNGRKNYREFLESYCNNIEKMQAENLGEEFIPPAAFDENTKVIWHPSKKDREQFIINSFVELETWLEKIKSAAKSLSEFKKGDFDRELLSYCNKIEESIPKNWEKVPQKYSEDKNAQDSFYERNDRHFEWLVDYQISPCKNYLPISKDNSVDRKTVTEAVRKIALQIGIPLRKSSFTGRPKNSKNSANTLRQLGIFNQ